MKVSPIIFGLMGSTIVLSASTLIASIGTPEKQFAAVLVVASANTLSDAFAVSAARGGSEHFTVDWWGFFVAILGEFPVAVLHTVFAYLIQSGHVSIFDTAFGTTAVITVLVITVSIFLIVLAQYRIITSKSRTATWGEGELSWRTLGIGALERFLVVVAVVAFVVGVTYGIDSALV